MLIHQRKFDLRVYFVTFIHEDSVDVWIYKDCYVKFSTPPFSLVNLDRSIHLTNYTVQKNFMTHKSEVPGARENMWSLSQLIEYFTSVGEASLWDDQIYPKIKKNLLAVVLTSLEGTELTPNSYELNGADVMIGFDAEPVLIEVNSRPALYLCDVQIEMITKRLLEDVIKLVVDRQRDPNADVGDFELIHVHNIPVVNPSPALNLTIVGAHVEKHVERIRPETIEIDSSTGTEATNALVLDRIVSNADVYLREIS